MWFANIKIVSMYIGPKRRRLRPPAGATSAACLTPSRCRETETSKLYIAATPAQSGRLVWPFGFGDHLLVSAAICRPNRFAGQTTDDRSDLFSFGSNLSRAGVGKWTSRDRLRIGTGAMKQTGLLAKRPDIGATVRKTTKK
jgi:hypothetical protein